MKEIVHDMLVCGAIGASLGVVATALLFLKRWLEGRKSQD